MRNGKLVLVHYTFFNLPTVVLLYISFYNKYSVNALWIDCRHSIIMHSDLQCSTLNVLVRRETSFYQSKCFSLHQFSLNVLISFLPFTQNKLFRRATSIREGRYKSFFAWSKVKSINGELFTRQFVVNEETHFFNVIVEWGAKSTGSKTSAHLVSEMILKDGAQISGCLINLGQFVWPNIAYHINKHTSPSIELHTYFINSISISIQFNSIQFNFKGFYCQH